MMSEFSQRASHRRWHQFRLSTVLVLVAIFAWAMSYWPFAKAVPVGYGYALTINTHAFRPVLALVVFLAWKWTWPRFVRWRERRSGPAPSQSPT